MATEDNENEGVSVSLPIPIVATGIILGLAAVGYLLLTRSEETDTVRTTAARQKGRKVGRKFGLMALITLIENDATRKVLVAALRAMAKRA